MKKATLTFDQIKELVKESLQDSNSIDDNRRRWLKLDFGMLAEELEKLSEMSGFFVTQRERERYKELAKKCRAAKAEVVDAPEDKIDEFEAKLEEFRKEYKSI